jgi:hypothetical protein
MFFDLFHLDGRGLTGLKLTQRKEVLDKLLQKSSPGESLRLNDHVMSSGGEMLTRPSKRANGPYTAGRAKNWLKVKCQLRQEFIVAGYSDARSGGRVLTTRLEPLAFDKLLLDGTAMSRPHPASVLPGFAGTRFAGTQGTPGTPGMRRKKRR